MEYKALKDIAKITMGQSPDSSSYNEEKDGLPFFQGNADFGELYPNERVWCNEPKKVAEPGDILISVRAPIGALNYAKDECCIGRGLAAITIEDEAERNYVFHLLKARNNDLNQKGTGSTFKAIGKNVLEEIAVPQISRDEQQKCMDMMDLLESIIRERKSQLDKLDELIRARFVELFGDLNTNPLGWDLKKFEDLTDLITDGEHATPRKTDKGIYLLSARNVLNHRLQLDDVDYIDEEEYERISKRVIPQAGDVLLSCSGTIGRCCCVPEGLKFQMVRSTAILRFKDFINPVFAEYMITSDYVQQQIDKVKTASSQANLFQGKIAKLKGFVPPIALQNEFAIFIKQVDKSKVVALKAA
ncbi:restriction endonuclease subunit S [Lachnospiraceae bacterium YH-ros2228]